MIRYFIRPVDRGQRSKAWAWACTLGKAREIKTQLQSVTGLKWKITIEETRYDHSV